MFVCFFNGLLKTDVAGWDMRQMCVCSRSHCSPNTSFFPCEPQISISFLFFFCFFMYIDNYWVFIYVPNHTDAGIISVSLEWIVLSNPPAPKKSRFLEFVQIYMCSLNVNSATCTVLSFSANVFCTLVATYQNAVIWHAPIYKNKEKTSSCVCFLWCGVVMLWSRPKGSECTVLDQCFISALSEAQF